MSNIYYKLIVTIAISSFCLVSIVSTQASKQKDSADDIFQNSTESCETIYNETAALLGPTLLVGRKTFPVTIPEIDQHCKLGTETYKKLRKWGKCLKGLPRQSLLVYLHGIKRFIRSTCNTLKRKQEAVEQLRCATPGTLDGWNECLNSVNRQMDFVASNSSSVAFLSDICCIYSSVLSCIDRKTGTIPGCSPTANTTKFFKQSLSLVLKEVIDLICSKYTTEEECLANNPEGTLKIKTAGESDKMVEGAFLISPVLRIVEKLSDDSPTDTN